MADDPRDLPMKTPPLDRAALERVLARAAELQSGEGEGDDPGLSDAQLLEIAKEVGLAPTNLRQALAEERSRGDAVESRGAVDVVFGPALATASRTVRGTPTAILDLLDATMQREEGLRVKRRLPDRMLWECAPGIVANLSRAFDIAGRGYHLTKADEVGATVVAVDAERTLVRMDASLAGVRAQHVGGGSLLAATGAVGSGVLFLLGVMPLLAVAPIVPFALLGWFAARSHQSARARAAVSLEQVLDRLERDERPRPSLLDALVPIARPR